MEGEYVDDRAGDDGPKKRPAKKSTPAPKAKGKAKAKASVKGQARKPLAKAKAKSEDKPSSSKPGPKAKAKPDAKVEKHEAKTKGKARAEKPCELPSEVVPEAKRLRKSKAESARAHAPVPEQWEELVPGIFAPAEMKSKAAETPKISTKTFAGRYIGKSVRLLAMRDVFQAEVAPFLVKHSALQHTFFSVVNPALDNAKDDSYACLYGIAVSQVRDFFTLDKV